jgi:uncharacterized membrane protein
MHEPWTVDPIWWIGAIELPVLGGLFWLMLRGRREVDQALREAARCSQRALNRGREDLAAFKLYVAEHYASMASLKDVERRLTEHLVRIEAKLDQGAGRAPSEGARP